MTAKHSCRLVAAFLGSGLLAATVIGSGILAVQPSGGNSGVALLGNTLATAAILYVLVATLEPVSGAHFKPFVTLVMALKRETTPLEALTCIVLQVVGCLASAMLAHAMFELPLIQTDLANRSGGGRMLAEGAATLALALALVFAILGGIRYRPNDLPAIVGQVTGALFAWLAASWLFGKKTS